MAWARHIHPVALHSLRSVHVSKDILLTIQKWELRFIRKMLKYRRGAWLNEAGEKVVETCEAFNRRSKKQIVALMSDCKVLPLHEKVVTAVFKEAWRLKEHQVGSLGFSADYVRGLRSSIWWEGVRATSSRKRTKGDTKHRRTGPITKWEEPLVRGLGLDWRDVRAKCLSVAEWRNESVPAVETVLRSWDLTVGWRQARAEDKPKRFKLSEAIPTQSLLESDVKYSGISGLLLNVVDNQSVAQILNGEIPYQGQDEEILGRLRNSTNLLRQLMRQGWDSREDNGCYWEWRPREKNKIADAYANQCLDNANSFVWDDVTLLNKFGPTSLQCFSDGGRRSDTQAAAAWVIYVVRENRCKVLGYGGNYIPGADSFKAEVLAVEGALNHVVSILRKRDG